MMEPSTEFETDSISNWDVAFHWNAYYVLHITLDVHIMVLSWYCGMIALLYYYMFLACTMQYYYI